MRISAAAALFLLLLPSPAGATPSRLTLTGITTELAVTEIAVRLSHKTTYTVRTLKPMEGHPFRLYVDFAGTELGPEMSKRRALGTGPVLRVRAGQFTKTDARIVFDLKEAAPYTVRTEQNPFRVFFRIETAAKATLSAKRRQAQPRRSGLARLWRHEPPRESIKPSGNRPHRESERGLTPKAANPPDATPTARAAPIGAAAATRHVPGPADTLPGSMTRSFSYPGITLATPPRVVIDPGHGGRDPGARGVNGIWEKDIALSVSRDLARRLRERLGIEVVLTRQRDKTLSFAERAAFARGADSLFISVHANACKQAWVKGVETFYSPATRNGTASRRLARLVHQRVIRSVDRTYGPVHDGGVHARRLAVLRHSHAPALLLEAAYLTNPLDSHRLRDAHYRNAVVDGVVDGIVDYLSGIEAPLRLVSRSDHQTRTQ